MTEKSGADILIEALGDLGVEVIFGYPGGAVLPIYDALFRHNAAGGRIKHILVRHEQGAAHAAEGYARSTGKPGVVLVTSGPGATNAVTGITDALMDSIPMVGHHRPGADLTDRHRCLSGGRYRRHHPPLHQAQLSGEGPDTLAATIHEAFHDRHLRPPRPGRGRYPQGCAVRHRRLHQARPDPPQRPIARSQGRAGARSSSCRYDGRGRTPDLLHRRRHHQCRARAPANCCANWRGSRVLPSPRP